MPQTILVTGASGYIAKYIVAGLLNAGHTVRGTLRRLDRGQEVRDAVAPLLTDAGAQDRLSFAALDLGQDAGWAEAMAGVDALMHTASPFPMAQPRDEAEVIRPAVDGALRALRAAHAAGVRRVVMTSSSVAVTGQPLPPGKAAHDEDDWTDPTAASANPYARSKTLAERAAWDFVRDTAPGMALTTINPVFVIGPPLDAHYGTSIAVVERLLRGRDPMLPNFGFPCVDVRDVAQAHVAALDTPASAGQRIIAADRFLWFPEMAQILKEAFPGRKIVTRKAPDLVVRFLALFDPAIRTVVPMLGQRDEVNAARAKALLGLDFRDTRASLRETAAWLIDNGRA